MNKTRARIETYTLAHQADLYVTDCPVCGIVYAIPNAMVERRRRDGESWWCPNGHSLSFHETEEDRQRKRADALSRQLTYTRAAKDQAEAAAAHQAAVARGYKGALVQSKKRAAKGMCPVPGCRRHFVDVQRHVTNQHPDYHGEVQS